MPDSLLPIQNLDKTGLVSDAPPVSLPANAFSDCLNVRFKDGAVRKMEGQVNIFPGLFTDGDIVKYVAWWPSPNLAQLNTGYYLVIVEQEDEGAIKDIAYFVKPGAVSLGARNKVFEASETWQHTFFQGGFALIINNGIDVPHYVLDPEGNEKASAIPPFAQLPGWDSYNVNEVVLDGTFEEANSRVFDLGQQVDFTLNRVIVEVLNSELDPTPRVFIFPEQATTYVAPDLTPEDLMVDGAVWNLHTDTSSRTTVVIFGDGLSSGNLAKISIRSRNPVEVRAGVIRSFGDFLVAGNLSERDETDTRTVIRSLPGVVRSSDVAAPGAIPNNWNPFATGVSTADEFVVTQDGIVQDLIELQSNLYIYSNSSISVMRLTGNAAVPLTVVPVTTSYGCLTTEGVLEYDGKHVVIGSQDIYLFGGHPGSIQSIADARVRNLFYNRLNPLQERSVFMLRYQQQDEIWVCYASVDSIGSARDEALIWNYRNNTWTRRSLPSIFSGNIGPVPGGGLPLAQIHLSGVASNNELTTDVDDMITGQGETDIQTIVVANTLNISETGIGEKTNVDVTVTGLPVFDTGTGPSLFEIQLQSGFDTGLEGTELYMSFTGIRARDSLGDPNVFSFEVKLPFGNVGPTRDTVNAIRTALNDELLFTGNFIFHDVDEAIAPNEFIIVGKNPNVEATSISIGERRFFSSGVPLAVDDTIDLEGVMNGSELSGTSRIYVGTLFVPSENVGRYHLFDIPTAPENATVNIFRVNANNPYPSSLGDSTDLYADASGTEAMYEDGRGGITVRPLSNVIPADAVLTYDELQSQRMYQTRTSTDSVELEISEYFVPARSGLHDFYVEIPDATTDVLNLNLRGHARPATSTGNNRFTNGNEERRGIPTFGTPVLNFRTHYRRYNPGSDAYVRDDLFVTRSRPTIVSIAGNYTSLDTIGIEVAEHIRDIFHNEPITEGFWDTRVVAEDNNVAELTSKAIGAYELDLESVSGRVVFPGGTIVKDNFVVTYPQVGRWNWRRVEPDARDVLGPTDDDTNTRPAYFPTFIFENIGTSLLERYTSLRTTIELDPEGEASLTPTVAAALVSDFIDTSVGWNPIASNGVNEVRMQTTEILNVIEPESGIDALGIGTVPANRPAPLWTVMPGRLGNVNFSLPNAITVSAVTTDFRDGSYDVRNTPSYLFLQLRNSEATQSTGLYENQELFIVEAPADGLAEPVSTEWILRIRRANPRLVVRNEGADGQFSIQPSNYGDLANFVLVPIINNDEINSQVLDDEDMVVSTITNITVCRDLLRASLYYDGTSANRIQIHPASAIPYISIPEQFLSTGHTSFKSGIVPPGGSLRNVSPVDIDTGVRGVSLIFDAIRPWPADEVNFNFEVPLFAARQDQLSRDSVTNVQVSTPINKILGADIGWTTPVFSTEPRVDKIIEMGTTRVIEGNDAPSNYESYVERKVLPLSPEFDTELLSSMSLWADGSTVEGFNREADYNRLEVRSAGSNNPGVETDLTVEGPSSQALKKNTYLISEDYKLDLRTNGRFFNLRITDFISDQSSLNQAEDVNVHDFPFEGKTFRSDSEWRISGIQLDIGKAGTR